MSRTVATVSHASLSTFAALWYFLFVIPRWWELTGFSSHLLGTVLRILLGIVVCALALPVMAVMRHDRKPEHGTPQLALSLLNGSIVAQLVAGVLIIGTAISEIWLSLDSVGMWLFGIYGAAAAIALLGIGAFYLAFVAEMPPPAPKPIKPKAQTKPKQGRRWGKKAGTPVAEEPDTAGESQAEPELDDVEHADDANAAAADDDANNADATADTETPANVEVAPSGSDALRPSGKRRAEKDA